MNGPGSARWREAGALGSLALPLTLSALVNIGIGITDVVMMAWLGPVALAAGAVASDFYSIVFYLGAGTLAAIAPLVSHARGARRPADVRRFTCQGLWAAAFIGVLGALVLWHAPALLKLVGVKSIIADTGAPYARMMALAFVPMMGVQVWRNFLSAHDATRIIFRITAVALPMNVLGNWLFMYGGHGLPAMGLAGVGLSSLVASAFMLVTLHVHVMRQHRYRRYRLFRGPRGISLSAQRDILRVGLPIGVSNLSEMGLFMFSTVVMGMISVEALAAHAVALRTYAVLFAIPLGLSQAVTVRVGYFSGAGDTGAMSRSTATALAMCGVLGVIYTVLLTTLNDAIPHAFLSLGAGHAEVVREAAMLLLVVAFAVPVHAGALAAAGALRGVKDTRFAMWVAVAGYWGLGFAVMMTLGLVLDMGALGVWIGLLAGESAMSLAIAMRLAWFWNANVQPVPGLRPRLAETVA